MSKQFVKISKAFGFNRNRLLFWEFFQESRGERVVLTFENGAMILENSGDVQTFRNWTENEAETAPETYQYTMFQPSQDTQDLGEILAPQRGK